MATVEVNPISVQVGDSISEGRGKSRKIKSVGFCTTKPECVHLDHECFDTRFATVSKVV